MLRVAITRLFCCVYLRPSTCALSHSGKTMFKNQFPVCRQLNHGWRMEQQTGRRLKNSTKKKILRSSFQDIQHSLHSGESVARFHCDTAKSIISSDTSNPARLAPIPEREDVGRLQKGSLSGSSNLLLTVPSVKQ